MANATPTIPDISVQPNSQESIQARVNEGRISWTGPLLLIATRPFLFFSIQALIAIVLVATHHRDAWHLAGGWWNVYGTVVDLGCLVSLRYFTRREGIRLRDLIGPIRLRFGRDLFVGLGLFAVTAPVFIGGSVATEVLLYGSFSRIPAAFLMQKHALPVWALVYSVTFWWILSSATEEATYQSYALPRLQALTGRTWTAVLVVAFWWNLQHCMLPLVFDWKYLLVRLVGFIPGIFIFMLVYLRTRRLAPLIVAHWCMDIVGAVMAAVW
jgi:hypothetical protein